MASIIYLLREHAPTQKSFMSEATMPQQQGHQRTGTRFGDASQDSYLEQLREDSVLNRFNQSE